jgi:hypothetical protein
MEFGICPVPIKAKSWEVVITTLDVEKLANRNHPAPLPPAHQSRSLWTALPTLSLTLDVRLKSSLTCGRPQSLEFLDGLQSSHCRSGRVPFSRFGLRRFDHQRAGHRKTHGRCMKSVVNQSLRNVIDRDAGGFLERLHVNNATIDASDDGPGLPEGFDPARSKGLGMKIIATLVKQIGRALQIAPGDEGRGTRFTVKFSSPLPVGRSCRGH